MKDYLVEQLVILSYAKKTQALLLIGIAFCVSIHILGWLVIPGINLNSLPPGIEPALVSKLAYKYDKIALIGLILVLLEAACTFIKERKKFHSTL